MTYNGLEIFALPPQIKFDNSPPLAYLLAVKEIINLSNIMTKKHFIAAAKKISLEPCHIMRANLAAFFVSLVQEDNPRFDHMRFYAACGL